MAQSVTNVPPTFLVVQAHAVRELDDRDGAREAFERALADGLLEQPRGPTWAMSLIWAADICAWLEDRSAAARLLDALAPFAAVMTWQYGPVARAVGLLELALGRSDEAQGSLREAMALCERMDARAFLAMVWADVGTLLLPSAEGRRLLDAARSTADELGMPGLSNRATTAARSL
jgi:precorrin-6x reductase